MKGPMTTQTLRGLATHGGMHWRGDRVDGFFGTDPCTEPTGAPCDEEGRLGECLSHSAPGRSRRPDLPPGAVAPPCRWGAQKRRGRPQ